MTNRTRFLDFEFRISNFELAVPNLHPPPGAPSRRGAVVEGLVARVARRREMVRACARQIAAYRGPQQRPVATAPGAAKPPRRPLALKDLTRPRETAAKRRFRDRDEFGPLGAFLRLERGRDRPSGHPDRVEGGKRGQRSGIGAITQKVGVRPRLNAARRRAAGAQRWRMVGPTSACARRARHPPTRGRGSDPRTTGGHGDVVVALQPNR
jgi:hypothetical protein